MAIKSVLPHCDRTMNIKLCDKRIPDTLVAPLFKDEQLPDALRLIAERASADAAALQNDFEAEKQEHFMLYAGLTPLKRYYLAGVGKNRGLAAMLFATRYWMHKHRQKLPKRLGLDLRYIPDSEISRMCEAAVCGLLLGLYSIPNYSSPQKEQNSFALRDIEILASPGVQKQAEPAIERAGVFAGVLSDILHLVNAPANFKTPESLAAQCVAWAQEYGFKATVLDMAELEAKGLNALLAVGKGSVNPPNMILLEYGPKSRKSKKPAIGLVGKGITFDTGGISIKPSTNMHYMKSDMGGAAAVIGAVCVAARLQLPARIVAAIPCAENMPDGQAFKPGDTILTFSGKTVEVTDTDAEGRLVLADALSWLLSYEKTDVLIDVATLTGNAVRALGYVAGGLFTPNDKLAASLSATGDACGERLWRLPLWDEYGADLKSDVADLRHYTGKPVAEAISAAKFLEHFVEGHEAWAHLDIAGMAFGDSPFASQKSATGYGVRLLVEYIESLC